MAGSYKLVFKARFAIIVTVFALVACGDDDKGSNPMGSGSSGIDVPSSYVFDSRFTPGESSVSYSGQVVRNLLLQDLKLVN